MLDKTETNLWYMEEVYYDNREKYKEIFEEEVISLPINPQIDLKEELHEESKYKAYLDLFTKIKKGDYFKYVAYYMENNRINRAEYIGKILGDFCTHYKFDYILGHTLPIKWIYKNNKVLNHKTYTDTIYEIEKCDIYNKFEQINLQCDKDFMKELRCSKSKIYFINNQYNKEDCNKLIISIDDKYKLDILKSINKDDYIIFTTLKRTVYYKELSYIQYQLIYKVKNDFSEDFIQFENGDYILEVEYLREIKKIKEFKDNYCAISQFSKLKHEESLGVNIFNKNLNTILYGQSGTGKTYNTYNEAIKLFFNLWYRENCSNDYRENLTNAIKCLIENKFLRFCTFHQSYGYEEFIEGIKSDKDGKFKVEDGIFKKIAIDALYEGLKLNLKLKIEVEKDSLSDDEFRKLKKELVLENIHNKDSFEFDDTYNYILVIDEINRGNISKIFGELITLLEEDKRLTKENEVLVKLPYSKELFCLPPNLYIIGTMNTSDKSIALMDTALRRRFSFKEMMPNHKLLKEVDNIKLDVMLEKINKRIEFLYDRDYMIGHAYLIKVKNLEDIVSVFKNKIIPLLQEYFYDDWEKIGLILGGIGEREDDNCIVYKKEINPSDIFNDSYEINKYISKTKYYIKKEISAKELRRIYE